MWCISRSCFSTNYFFGIKVFKHEFCIPVTQKKRRQLPLNPVEITLTTEDALDQLSYFDYDFKLNI